MSEFASVEQRNARQLALVIDKWRGEVNEQVTRLEARVTAVEVENRALREQLAMAVILGRGSGPTS